MIMTDENGRSVTTGHGHWCTCGSSNGEPEVCSTMNNNNSNNKYYKVCIYGISGN